MPNQFSIYRVFCCTPPGQEEERELFLAKLAAFTEQVTHPEWILFAPAAFPTHFNAELQQGAVKENIRSAFFFLGFFGEDPPAALYKRFAQYAIECAADEALPLKRVTVFFKESDDITEEMRALRARFHDQCEVRGYRRRKDLEPQLEDLLAGWFAAVQGVTIP